MDNNSQNSNVPDPDWELQKLTPEKLLCGRYRLEKIAGEGGMGVVWKAYDTISEGFVALKFVAPEIRHSEGAMAQVKATFNTIRELSHPNICKVCALEKDPEIGYFVVMLWLDGKPLNELTLPQEKVLPILEKVADALDYAHGRRVMHRDIKPSNIFVSNDGEVKLIDFGIAAEIQNSISMNTSSTVCRTSGTRPYMAPEQWRGGKQNEKTDQYALGVVAYELYAGCLPFQNPDTGLLRIAVLNDTPEPIEAISRGMNAAILRAMAKERNARFATCREFIDTLSKAPSGDFTSDTSTITSCDLPPADPFQTFFEQEDAEEEARRAKLPELALEEYQKRKYAEAAELVREYLQYYPKNDGALRFLARCESKMTTNTGTPSIRRDENTGTTLPASLKAGDRKVWTVSGIEYAFRWCPAGEFTMGSPADEPGRYDDETQHKVKLTKGFWLMETEVTQAMWASVMNTTLEEQARKMLHDDTVYNFSSGKKTVRDLYGFTRDRNPSEVLCGQGPKHPMYYVNWHESVEFCRRLSSLLGGVKVELPTEAQWEYACRAGSPEALPGRAIEIKGQNNAPALDPLAWYGGNSMQEFVGKSAWNSRSWKETQYPGGKCGVHPVGKKDANAWGLYDMIGNVYEWCSDWYDADYYSASPTSDPTGPSSGSDRVFRGGGWSYDARLCRSASRNRNLPEARGSGLGLRPLVVPASKE